MKKCSVNCFKSRRRMLCAPMIVVLALIALTSLAQDGKAGIEKANDMVRGYFDDGVDLMYGIGAIIAIIGAIRVYTKWVSGSEDLGRIAAAWFGSCIFLVIVATVIRSFFGI